MCIVIPSQLVRKASQYLVYICPSRFCSPEDLADSLSVKSLPPVLFPLSQRKQTHQLCLEWRGPVTFLPIDRSNPGGTREEGRGDEQLKKQQTRWPQRDSSSVDSLLCSPSRLLLFFQSEGDWSANNVLLPVNDSWHCASSSVPSLLSNVKLDQFPSPLSFSLHWPSGNLVI